MSRKQHTVATFAVTIQVPAGLNLADIQVYIRAAIETYGGRNVAIDKPFNIPVESFTVALTKKVTTYGNN